MLTPGKGLPSLVGSASLPNQSAFVGSLSPTAFTPSSVVTSNSGSNGVPASFGQANTSILAAQAGTEGAYSTQGGIFWNSTNSLADNLPLNSGMAAVSFSAGSVTFTDTGTNTILSPGAELSITGTLGSSSDSYVAAGLQIFVTITGDVNQFYQLDSIAMGVSKTVPAFATTGILPSGAIDPSQTGKASAHLSSGGLLTGTATSFLPQITVTSGEQVQITAYLTLITDPGSTINVSGGLDSGFDGDLPTFGAFVGPPSVPEPSTIVMLGAGLAMTGLWSRSGRRRAPARA